MAQFKSICPVSDENPDALPVKELANAVAFYQAILGFSVVSRDSSSAVLARDDLRIGLVRNDGHEPGKAGSVAIAVDDLDGLHRELQAKGAKPGEFGIDEWGGKQHRTFYLREATNGYCYCFYGADRG